MRFAPDIELELAISTAKSQFVALTASAVYVQTFPDGCINCGGPFT
jgi:hypothetical protein